LSERAHVAASTISEVEHGWLVHISLQSLRQIASALDVRVEIKVRTPHGDLDRLVNAGHAALHETIARYLRDLPGWVHAPEVSFAIFGERGVIDILAFHEQSGCLLVIELKTELVSLEDLLGTMDVRTRHARTIARERGWHARSVSAWIIFADTDVTKRRVKAHSAALRSAYPIDGRQMRGWMRAPAGSVRAMSFVANFAHGDANATAAVRRRVRRPRLVETDADPAA
jgi:hypothetical protein